MSDVNEFGRDVAHPTSRTPCVDAASGRLRLVPRRQVLDERHRVRNEEPSAEIRAALRLMALEDLLFPEVAP